ncbi:MAG TPA: 50S ribosomal protein L9 [Limnochordales bacterium]
MKVILTQDVKGLGRAGQLVEVADGYGRNYLVPRGMAVVATEGSARAVQRQQEQLQKRLERELEQARQLAARLEGQPLVIGVRAGEGGRLYGSVTAADVAAALQRQFGVTVDRRRVELESPIKSLGSYPVTVRLAPGIATTMTVVVQSQEQVAAAGQAQAPARTEAQAQAS